LKPNGSYYAEFCTQRFDTGAATDAGGTPTATANKNGIDDGDFALTITKIDIGRYKVTGMVPAGYSAGDIVVVTVAATVNSVAGKGVIDQFQVVSARPGTDDIPVEDVVLAASQGNYAPAKAGDAMVLTAAYDPAKTAASQASVNAIDGIADSILADTGELQTDLANGGRLDLLVDGIKTKTDNLPASPAAVGSKMDIVDSPSATGLGAIVSAIWDKLLTGISTSGSIGKLIKDFLDAAVSTRLPTTSYSAAPSAASIDAQLSGTHGAGAWGASAVGTIAYPDPIDPFLGENNDPMAGVKVEAFSNEARTALVDVQTTDVNGNFQFHLNAGEYWFRASLLQHVSYEWYVELGAEEEEE
jgi:hypothetical protein